MTLRLNLTAVERQLRDAGEHGVLLGCEHILQVSNTRVPIQEATLERSGMVSTDGLEGAVSYDTPYAVRQHEELDYQHDQGRQAKYLESAWAGERDVVAQILAGEYRGVISG